MPSPAGSAGGARSAVLPAIPFSASPVLPQEEDYSVSGMFMDAHGDFMLQQERYTPMARFDFLWQPNSDLSGEPGDFDLVYPTADVKIPLAVDPDSYVELGGYFGVRSYQTSSAFAAGDESLYEIGLDIGAGTFVNEDFLLEGRFYPGIYSDLDETLHSEDYQWYFDALGVFRTQEDLFWKVGVSHNGLFRKLNAYPLLGVSYVINSQWRVDVLLPRSAEVSYAVNASTILLVDLTLDGNQYETRDPAAAGSSASHVQELRLGFGGIYRFSDQISMFGRIGSTLAGDYAYTNGNDVFSDGALEPGFFLNVGLGLDF